jgi:hypothetical protein
MLTLLSSLAIKYGQALVVTAVSLIVRQIEKNATVKKYTDKIDAMIKANQPQ